MRRTKDAEQTMNRRTLALWGTAAVALAAALAWAFSPRPVEVEIATAGRGPFEVTIDEDGKTRLPDRYVVSAPLAGRLARITLREGDAVAAGDVVATLTPALPAMLDERSAREAGSRVEAAQAQLQRAGARIARVRVALEQARLEAGRSEQLARDGFIAPTKRESDALAVEAAARELDAAVEERHVAEHEVAQARAALLALRQVPAPGGRGFAIRSPIAGQVLRIQQASEGTVASGAPLLEVGQLEHLEVVAELLTADALRTPAGTPVRIERWGGPVVLQGRVRRVEPAAFTKVSALGVEEQRVNVVIDLASPRAQWQALGDGYRVSLRFVVTAEADVLQVPASAVFPLPEGDDHQMAVFVVDGGQARLNPVQLRARNGTAAWIGGGLQPGARVIVYPPTAVRDGVRVKERKV
jgi:HlyD family secretion protein